MDNKPLLKVDFTDFWKGLIKTDNYFYHLLSEKYNVQISDDPDILFFSSYGSDANHCKYKCTKVFFASENVRPPYHSCDFSFSFDYSTHQKNYRLPLYALYGNVELLTGRQVDADKILAAKTKFCCFLVSNPECEIRNHFFQQLSARKSVDSGGKTLNNVGYLVSNKVEFIKEYKFVIAFENATYPGYTTEKIFEPLQYHCVPIYWGNPLVEKDFNGKSFINCHRFPCFEKAIDHVLAVDNNDALYKQYLQQPPFENDKVNEYVKKENVVHRLEEIVTFSKQRQSFYNLRIRPLYCSLLHLSHLYAVRVKRVFKRRFGK